MSHPQSNAPEGFLDVSPEGWPLFYALADGKPTAMPWFVYDDASHTAPTAAEALIARNKAGRRSEKLRVWQMGWYAQRHAGPIQASTLAQVDPRAAFYLRKRADERKIEGERGDLFEMSLNGTNSEIATLKAFTVNNMPPDFTLESYRSRLTDIIDEINGTSPAYEEVEVDVEVDIEAEGEGGETTRPRKRVAKRR